MHSSNAKKLIQIHDALVADLLMTLPRNQAAWVYRTQEFLDLSRSELIRLIDARLKGEMPE